MQVCFFFNDQINQENSYFFLFKGNQYLVLFDLTEPELLKRTLNITLYVKGSSSIYITLMTTCGGGSF
jgi:hypothetical protein